jgi:RNA polymerase sigma factor (sigma-70 family)
MAGARGVTAGAAPDRLAVLMAAAQAGDAAAYAMLLKDCVPLIRQIARQTRTDPNHIDDVVQDALLTIHRARQTFDPARPFAPWLRAIVQRRGIDVARRTGRQAARELHAPLAYEAHPDPASGAEQHAEDKARAERLAEAVAQLPPGQRLALEQLGLQERSLAEVSASTGRSVVSLKVNLHRALKSLRSIMGQDRP